VPADPEDVYRRIGELVVGFQWVENLFRQIGWFLADPHRTVWPPKDFRTGSTSQLVHRVSKLYEEVIPQLGLPHDHEEEIREEFSSLVKRFDLLRKQRNRFLHSAYVELKGGEEIVGLLRADIKLHIGDSGGSVLDSEILSDASFNHVATEIGDIGFRLDIRYKELLQRLR